MLRAMLVLATCLATATLAASQEPVRVDRARLEWFKKLTPEQKKLLRERLEQLKKLPPEERQRLIENWKKFRELPEDARRAIQDRLEQLTPEERKIYADVTHIYFKQLGKDALRSFPREMFFLWLQKNHPTDVERIRYLDKPARIEHVERLYNEFKDVSLKRAELHIKVHRCLPPERIDDVRKAAEFWTELQKVMQETRQKHQANRKPNDKRPGPRK